MYCNRCGKPLPNGSTFCNYCGAAQPRMQAQQQPPRMQYKQPPQKKKGASPILIFGAIFFGCIFILMIILASTGGHGDNTDNTEDIVITTAATTADKATEVPKEEGETSPPTEPETLKRKTSVSITGHHLTQNSLGDNVLVVDYDFYNGEDEPKSFSWSVIDQCYQNGVECSTFVFVDEVDTHKQNADVQPGVTLSLSIAYKLDDLSDVNIVVKKLLSDDEYINQTFSPQS